MPLSNLYSSQVKDLALEWSYYSGKIEGSTYTFVQTEMLIKDNIVSGRDYTEAKMLKNMYNTFVSEVEYIKKENNIETIDERLVLRLHSYFSDDLLENRVRGVLRTMPVRISGTEYVPPMDAFDIERRFSEIIKEQHLYENPFERAIFLHCNMARLQPFIDCNKRTSRMLESIVLMNADIVPIFSVKEEDMEKYKDGILRFYETGDYEVYADFVLEQKLKYLQFFSKEDLREEFEKSLKKGRKL